MMMQIPFASPTFGPIASPPLAMQPLLVQLFRRVLGGYRFRICNSPTARPNGQYRHPQARFALTWKCKLIDARQYGSQ